VNIDPPGVLGDGFEALIKIRPPRTEIASVPPPDRLAGSGE
jgi:hypothetical protein